MASRYSEWEGSIAYPGWDFASAGKTTRGKPGPDLPQAYKDYARFVKQREQEREEREERERKERFDDFMRGCGGTFFGGTDGPSREPSYPHSVFGLPRSASCEEMRRAYRKRCRETHPDKTGDDTADEFRKVQEAWDCYSAS